jgi:medium-chain acyl-[acyl-carrier-protein] hydrolase
VSHRAVVRLSGGANTSFTLLCVPQAGGGAATFQPLRSSLPAQIGLCAVRLPGRESRLNERPIRWMDEAVAAVLQDMDVVGPAPLAMLGYCSGSFIADQVARRLSQAGVSPTRLFVLASPAPRLVAPARWIHTRSQRELIDYVRGSQLTSEAILQEPQLFEIFEPAIRADFETYETWNDVPTSPITIPITVIGAAEDPSVDLDDLLRWRTLTSNEFTLRMQPGGHDFLGSGTAMMARAIAADLLPLSR